MLLLDFKKPWVDIVADLKSSDQTWASDILEFVVDWHSDSDSFWAQSSGSTGKAKEMKFLKSSAAASAAISGAYFGFSENTKAILCMSPRFIGGKMMIVRAIVYSMKLYCFEPSLRPFKNLSKDMPFDFAPMVLPQVLESIKFNEMPNISKVLIGGSSIPYQAEQELWKQPNSFYSSYAMTETLSHIAIRPIVEGRSSQVYQLLQGFRVRLDSEQRLIVAADFLENEVHTNDVVELCSDNEFRVLGRYDNIINCGGVKINPEQIEEKLKPFVKSEFIVCGVEDKQFVNSLALVVQGYENLNLDLLNSNLSKTEKIRKLYFVDEFLKTENQKVQRKQIQNLIKN